MPKPELTFGGLHIEHPTEREREKGAKSRIFLVFFTAGGAAREVNLTDQQALALIERAAKFVGIRQR
jgi:hypothetical protein